MSISFMRVDDRIIHGQIIIRWQTEYPCDGIIAVDDKAANNDILKSALLAASTKKTFVWTIEKFKSKMQEAVNSEKKYFLITKNPQVMRELLVDCQLNTSVKVLNVGPQSARVDTINIGKNADITKEEIKEYEAIYQANYSIEFQLVPDAPKVLWENVREKLLK